MADVELWIWKQVQGAPSLTIHIAQDDEGREVPDLQRDGIALAIVLIDFVPIGTLRAAFDYLARFYEDWDKEVPHAPLPKRPKPGQGEKV